MPYIKQEQRPDFDKILNELKPDGPGELNYVITRLCISYAERKGIRYGNLNEVMGVLSSVAREFYRRLVAPYEDKKMRENGDVKGYDNES